MAFAYYKSLTIDHLQCGSSDSTDFPLTVFVTDADLKTVGNAGFVQSSSGFDIRPYSDSALTTPLTFELVSYAPTTGAIEMHIKIPTLSHTADTVIYLAFGDATITTDGSSTATWDSNFKGVWHLKETGTGSTSDYKDSTSNGINGGGTSNEPTAATGQIGTGQSFNGASNGNVIDLGTSTTIQPTAAGTISAWFSKSDGNLRGIFGWGDFQVADRNGVSIFHGAAGAGTLQVELASASANQVSTGISVATSTWVLATVTWDGTTFKVYTNGTQGYSAAQTVTPNNGVYHTHIGNDGRIGGTSFYFKGTIDEVRVSNVARSADWITAQYNNQKTSSTFITYGAKTAVGGNVYSASLALAATSALSVAAGNSISASLATAATSGFGIAAGNSIPASVALPATSGYIAGCTLDRVGSLALPASSSLTMFGGEDFSVSLSLAAIAGLGTSGAADFVSTLSMPATAAFSRAAAATMQSGVSLGATAGFVPVGSADLLAAAGFAATSTLDNVDGLAYFASLTLASTAAFSAALDPPLPRRTRSVAWVGQDDGTMFWRIKLI